MGHRPVGVDPTIFKPGEVAPVLDCLGGRARTRRTASAGAGMEMIGETALAAFVALIVEGQGIAACRLGAAAMRQGGASSKCTDRQSWNSQQSAEFSHEIPQKDRRHQINLRSPKRTRGRRNPRQRLTTPDSASSDALKKLECWPMRAQGIVGRRSRDQGNSSKIAVKLWLARNELTMLTQRSAPVITDPADRPEALVVLFIPGRGPMSA